jgi:putative CocE/NonD family hydrolase
VHGSAAVGRGAPGRGTESRGWVEGRRPAPARPPVAISESRVTVAVRDGVRLGAVLIRPDGPDAVPGVVVTNGYSGLDEPLLPPLRDLARAGYAVVMARLRGVPPSEGAAGLYECYGPDGHDVVEWLAAQPFSTGRVGMVGASLLGISQWLAAKERPPHLTVVVPDDAPNDTYRYLWWAGGMPPGPGRRARAEVPGVESEYALAAGHPWFDGFWRERSATREDIEELARSGLPALTSTGWDSYLVDAASRAFTWMRAAGAGPRARLVIGPWGHAAMFSNTSMVGEDPPGALLEPYRGAELQRMWLDRWLRDGAGELDDLPPVQIFVQGPDRWRFEDDWPLPDEQRVVLHLSADRSGTSRSRNDGRATEAPDDAAATAVYEYDPATAANPVAVSMPRMVLSPDAPPRIEEPDLPAGARRPYGRLLMDRSGYEGSALTWTTGVLTHPCEITGYPVLEVRAAVSHPDAAFVVELTDVAPADGAATDGAATEGGGGATGWTSDQITRGYLQADAAFSRTGPTAIDPDEVHRYRIELSPTSYVVPAGHRARVVLQGAAVDPALDLAWQGPGLCPHPYTITVHTGPDGSRVELPVVGADPEWR